MNPALRPLVELLARAAYAELIGAGTHLGKPVSRQGGRITNSTTKKKPAPVTAGTRAKLEKHHEGYP